MTRRHSDAPATAMQEWLTSPMVDEVFWIGPGQGGIMPNAEGRVPSVIEDIVDTISRPLVTTQ